jgi:hypothetical protein
VANNFQKYAKQYLGIFEPLFQAAWEKSEFNLILTLLAIRGSSDWGWEPSENTIAVVEDWDKQQEKLRYSLRGNVNLWVYAHIIECAEHYELVANLINVAKGGEYLVANHKSKPPRFQNLKIEQKIQRLEKIAKGTAFENVSKPFKDAFDLKLRNAIDHADYSFKEGAVTIIDDAGPPKIYSQQQVVDLMNKALAFHEVLTKLKKHYQGYYEQPTVIDSSPGFGGGKPMKMTLIVRKRHGVIGVRGMSNATDMGKPFEVRMCRPLTYEQKMIERGVNFLPPSRFEQANKFLDKLPRRIARKISKPLYKAILMYYDNAEKRHN